MAVQLQPGGRQVNCQVNSYGINKNLSGRQYLEAVKYPPLLDTPLREHHSAYVDVIWYESLQKWPYQMTQKPCS